MDVRTINLTRSFLSAAAALPKSTMGKLLRCLDKLVRGVRSAGMNLEKLSGRAQGLWSLRVDEQYRVILSLFGDAATLHFVGTHDDAYRAADRIMPEMVIPSSEPTVDARPQRKIVSGIDALVATSSTDRVPPDVEVAIAGGSLRSTIKYFPLATHLLALPATTNDVRMEFGEIEHILAAPLPRSATTHRAWWANDVSSHVQSIAWMMAGFRSEQVDLRQRVVTFRRRQYS